MANAFPTPDIPEPGHRPAETSPGPERPDGSPVNPLPETPALGYSQIQADEGLFEKLFEGLFKSHLGTEYASKDAVENISPEATSDMCPPPGPATPPNEALPASLAPVPEHVRWSLGMVTVPHYPICDAGGDIYTTPEHFLWWIASTTKMVTVMDIAGRTWVIERVVRFAPVRSKRTVRYVSDQGNISTPLVSPVIWQDDFLNLDDIADEQDYDLRPVSMAPFLDIEGAEWFLAIDLRAVLKSQPPPPVLELLF